MKSAGYSAAQVRVQKFYGESPELRISYSLLVAFCYRHLPAARSRRARLPDHGAGICIRRTRRSPDPCRPAGSVISWRVSPEARSACSLPAARQRLGPLPPQRQNEIGIRTVSLAPTATRTRDLLLRSSLHGRRCPRCAQVTDRSERLCLTADGRSSPQPAGSSGDRPRPGSQGHAGGRPRNKAATARAIPKI